jgi:hypothetical protein
MSSASIVQGSPAAPSLLRQGVATIAATGYTVLVPDAAITANSVVVCWGLGAAEAVGGATAFSVDALVPGTGFSINSDVVAIAAKNVGFAVLKY